jgi:hypothetical protein
MEGKTINLHDTWNELSIFASIAFDLNISNEAILSLHTIERLHVIFRLYAILRKCNLCLETEIIQRGFKWMREGAA